MSNRLIHIIEIDNNGVKRKINAFSDTGNLLREPVTGLPVVVVERKSIIDILPRSITEGKEDGNRISLIPFNTISGTDGALLAFKPERVAINGRTIECLIGVYNGRLSDEDEFNALINPMIAAV